MAVDLKKSKKESKENMEYPKKSVVAHMLLTNSFNISIEF
jgi:hypothetical protein